MWLEVVATKTLAYTTPQYPTTQNPLKIASRADRKSASSYFIDS
ncbi:hypothetical protein MIZ03_2657 [Rhodoferax lithotrophicus]|uniref:Uncharacterized protein n=1 Tax=Rhodoferax lithotrophicus TaxID=2798804 RepID=A0ABM7MNE2_9BURK|nr:hypothetical protein MIZ03_2657 [Rhodoferax sp. MIZ03]